MLANGKDTSFTQELRCQLLISGIKLVVGSHSRTAKSKTVLVSELLYVGRLHCWLETLDFVPPKGCWKQQVTRLNSTNSEALASKNFLILISSST